MFQIWFDPDISKTISKPASYSDYKLESFPLSRKEKSSVLTIKGKGSPFKMESEGIEIYEINYDDGFHEINLNSELVYSFFIKKGTLTHENQKLARGTFLKIDKESKLNFESKNGLEIFKIISPIRTSYSTYYERFN